MTPKNVADLVAIIRKAQAKHQKVRAFGAWSFSDCAMTSIPMASPKERHYGSNG
jgi:hypothetical protein